MGTTQVRTTETQLCYCKCLFIYVLSRLGLQRLRGVTILDIGRVNWEAKTVASNSEKFPTSESSTYCSIDREYCSSGVFRGMGPIR